MSRELEWTGQADFAKEPLKSWIVGDHIACVVRSAKGFTFATVNGAGHMVRYRAVHAFHAALINHVFIRRRHMINLRNL